MCYDALGTGARDALLLNVFHFNQGRWDGFEGGGPFFHFLVGAQRAKKKSRSPLISSDPHFLESISKKWEGDPENMY